jgi:hypothetical protein
MFYFVQSQGAAILLEINPLTAVERPGHLKGEKSLQVKQIYSIDR